MLDITADTLIYSDDPETVHGPPTMPLEGILYQHDVGAGRTRVFYYHVNGAAQQRAFGVRVKNLNTTAPTAIRTRGFVADPQGGAHMELRTGHRSSVGFFKVMGGPWSPARPIGAGGELILGVVDVPSGLLASVYVDVDADPGAQLRISVVAATSADRLSTIAATGQPFPPDNFGRCGVYDTSNGDGASLTYTAGGAPAVRIIPGVIVNQRVPADLPHGHSSDAQYAIYTRIEATFENLPGALPAVAAAYLVANGGATPATCWIDGDIVEVGLMTSAPNPPRKRYQLRRYPLGPGETVTSTIVVTIDPSGSAPLDVVLDADDGGLAPGDQVGGSIVFVPGGAPWNLA